MTSKSKTRKAAVKAKPILPKGARTESVRDALSDARQLLTVIIMLSPRSPDHGRIWTLAKVAFDKLGVALAELGLAEAGAEEGA